MKPTRYHNIYLDGAVCFWTSAIVERIPLLRSRTAAGRLLEILDACRRKYGVKLLGYVVMPDHIHLAVWAESATATQLFLQRFLCQSSAALAAMLDSAAKRDPVALRWSTAVHARARGKSSVRIWKERGRAFPVTRDDALLQKLEYMHNNPVRAGLVQCADDWEYSSALWYSRCEGPLEIDSLD